MSHVKPKKKENKINATQEDDFFRIEPLSDEQLEDLAADGACSLSTCSGAGDPWPPEARELIVNSLALGPVSVSTIRTASRHTGPTASIHEFRPVTTEA